jgi:deferrochelatase/peroxidase EfeB
MTDHKGRCPMSSRRGFLAAAGSIAGALGASIGLRSAEAKDVLELAATSGTSRTAASGSASEAFWGKHQAGILTSAQSHIYFAAFDVVADKASDVEALLLRWTEAAARMAKGETAEPLSADLSVPAGDSGDALDLGAARLTLTFGFGPGLFIKAGKDRYGLAAQRPAALVDLPAFNGDQLIAAQTGGDLCVQACADDPQVAFHAVRQLSRLAYGVAQLRWVQSGFSAEPTHGETPRNLMGFKDGTQNPVSPPPHSGNGGTTRPMLPAEKVVWAGDESPGWMRGGSYLVVRRIRISLEHWDRTETDFQEQVIGRHKSSGAPLGGHSEFEPLNLDATDKDGNFVIPETAHVRMAAAASHGGAQILRRSYSYNDGVSFIAERWPPWHQGMLYDAGLLFIAYQSDPRTGFIPIYDTMSKIDALNQYTTHVGSGLFACPHGVVEGEFIGQSLFQRG